MPKRNSEYMDQQRNRIAAGALSVLLEKGVYGTSLRDICARTGVSMGALYTHFQTKDEMIVAACALDYEHHEELSPACDWQEYVAIATHDIDQEKNDRYRRRMRLSLQFVAELSLLDRNPPGLSTIYVLYRDRLSRSLEALRDRGEITLPLGIAETTEIHMQLIGGANYQVAADRELDRAAVRSALEKALALTAGRPA